MMRYICAGCKRGMHEFCMGLEPPPPGMMGGSECVCKGDCGPQCTLPEDQPLIDALNEISEGS
jgi:hypothetical protein